MTTSATPAPAGEPEAGPQSWLTRAINATPVVLSVLATVLAGLSSRELTLAHYYRSLATQLQSKADDQWNFFQAKRIRGTVVETAGDGGDAVGDRPDAARLAAAADRLAEDLGRAREEAGKLVEAVDAAKGDLGSAAGSLRAAADRLASLLRDQAPQAEEARRHLGRMLKQPDFKEALGYLESGKVPETEKRPLEDDAIRKAVAAVEARQSDRALDPLIRPIDPERLTQEIDKAEANARDFDARAKPVGNALKQLDKVVSQQAALVRPVTRAAGEVRAALADIPAGDRKGLNDVRTAAAALDRTVTALGTLTGDVRHDFRSAERAYTARRYDAEARYNQDVALLYEVLVRKESQISEGHMTKSAHIFYAMLAAQGGVTIATLAMAVRHKSLLWTLATVAGVSALLFASYVFVGM